MLIIHIYRIKVVVFLLSRLFVLSYLLMSVCIYLFIYLSIYFLVEWACLLICSCVFIVNLIQDGGAHELTTRTRNSSYIANFSSN